MKLIYSILYVNDVERSVNFYEDAFGLKRRFLHESGQYAEMETGDTTLAFSGTSLAQSIVPTGYRENSRHEKPAGFQIALCPDDVGAAFLKALKAGAEKVSSPEVKPWGWESAVVRDLDGILVELAREVHK